jgi:hypothetical protein
MSSGMTFPATEVGGLWQRLAQGGRRLWHRSDWVRFARARWADGIMAAAVTDRFHAKQGRSTGRWVLHADGTRLAVYLKRHYRLGRLRGWLATFWPRANWSPAVQEWGNLQWAADAGFPVPAAVAAGEFIGPWGRLQSFLAVEELDGMLPLNEAVPLAANRLSGPAFSRWKRSLAGEVARLTRALHERRHFHKDLYLCHFYIREEDTSRCPVWPGRVHVIDLHRLGRHRLGWRWWQVKDLAQLLFSSDVVGITDQDRLRFWASYSGGAGSGLTARWLLRAVRFKGERYRAHNARRSQGSGTRGAG